jgi:hypothetical protein
MRLLPFENLIIETSLSKEETITVLRNNTEHKTSLHPWERRKFRSKREGKEFEGTISTNEFEMKRMINYRNSFLPTIRGRIQSDGQHTRLSIRLSMQLPVIIFMAVWFSAAGLVFFLVLLNSPKAIFIPAGMLFFAYILVIGGYSVEANKAKDSLLHITSGQIVKG